ncbi:MAG: tyrosine-type recombinase/integrase, partial [Candidatus Obscuribacterales bacterium]|nr:tyrosine-type recombinase/integrase [Candidatus Obscuribacterales bacterium]
MTVESLTREIQTKQAELQWMPPTFSLILTTWLVLSRFAKRETLTVGDLWICYLEDHAKPYVKSWRNSERCFHSYFAPLKDLDCESLTRLEVQRWYSELGQAVGWTTANRALELLSSIYNRCIDWEMIPARNPVSRIKKKRLLSRERYLQPNELSRFFAATATLRYDTTRDFFHILLFTGQRSGNVRNMQWSEIDFDLKIWHIPMTKNGTSHTL